MRPKLRFFFGQLLPLILVLALQIALYIVIIRFFANWFIYISIASSIFSVLIVIFLLSKDEQPLFKISWIILILLFPVFGGFLYVMVNIHRLSYKHKQKLLKTIAYRQTLLENIPPLVPTKHERTFHYLAQDGWKAYQNTTATFIKSGEEKLALLLEELKKAATFIFIEYFIITESEMWEAILTILKEKINEGVIVKLIYDDFGTTSKLPFRYHAYLRKLGIDVVRFNKLGRKINFANNYRNHRKIVVIDNKVAFTGGINIGDEYTNKKKRFGHWHDAAIMVKGAAVSNFTAMFLENYAFETKVYLDAKPYLTKHDSRGEGYFIPFADTPLDDNHTSRNMYIQMINNAKKSVTITTPYLILDGEMGTALKMQAESGVDVKIIIPSEPDKKLVYMVSESYVVELAKRGVKIYKYNPGFIHSKLIVVDNEEAMIGTANLDFRSLYLHFENNLWLSDAPTIKAMNAYLKNTLAESSLITKENAGKVGIFKKLFVSFLRAFTPLL